MSSLKQFLSSIVFLPRQTFLSSCSLFLMPVRPLPLLQFSIEKKKLFFHLYFSESLILVLRSFRILLQTIRVNYFSSKSFTKVFTSDKIQKLAFIILTKVIRVPEQNFALSKMSVNVFFPTILILSHVKCTIYIYIARNC